MMMDRDESMHRDESMDRENTDYVKQERVEELLSVKDEYVKTELRPGLELTRSDNVKKEEAVVQPITSHVTKTQEPITSHVTKTQESITSHVTKTSHQVKTIMRSTKNTVHSSLTHNEKEDDKDIIMNKSSNISVKSMKNSRLTRSSVRTSLRESSESSRRESSESNRRESRESSNSQRVNGKHKHCCCECHKTFQSAKQLVLHEKLHQISHRSTANKLSKQTGGEQTRDKHTPNKQALSEQTCVNEMDAEQRGGKMKRVILKSFYCTLCKKTVRLTSKDVQTERLTHQCERPYTCYMCNKSFKRSSHLKNHHSVHFGQRPYECSQCDKAFKLLLTLRSHEKTHSRRRKCRKCEKSFQTVQSLHKHQRQQHKIKQ